MTTRTQSTVEQLPEDLITTIRDLVSAGTHTYSAIHQHVQAMGADVSRSAIARWGKSYLAQEQALLAARDMAKELLDIGDGADLTELASRLISVKLLAVLMQNDVFLEDEGLGLGHLVVIARSLATLQSAALAKAKYDDERRAASDEGAARAARGGLSQETVEAIKGRVLGLTQGEDEP